MLLKGVTYDGEAYTRYTLSPLWQTNRISTWWMDLFLTSLANCLWWLERFELDPRYKTLTIWLPDHRASLIIVDILIWLNTVDKIFKSSLQMFFICRTSYEKGTNIDQYFVILSFGICKVLNRNRETIPNQVSCWSSENFSFLQ